MIAVAQVSVNHDGRGGTAPDPWFGIREASLRFVSSLLGFKLTMHLFLALLFFITVGFRLLLVALSGRILLLGRTVSVFGLDLLLCSILYIGLLVLRTLVILVFPVWSF